MNAYPGPDPYALVAQALECPRESLNEHSGLAVTPEWDSFGHLKVLMVMSETYGIEINDQTIVAYQTMAGILSFHQEWSSHG